MWTIVKSFIGDLLKGVVNSIIPLIAYFQGRQAKENEQMELDLENTRKGEKIEQDNLSKSSSTVLNELRDNDTRNSK